MARSVQVIEERVLKGLAQQWEQESTAPEGWGSHLELASLRPLYVPNPQGKEHLQGPREDSCGWRRTTGQEPSWRKAANPQRPCREQARESITPLIL